MTAPASPPDWEAIARFLAGESPAEEAAVVRAWFDANPADRRLVEGLDDAAVVETPADIDVEAALRRVHERMAEPGRPQLTLERGGARAGTTRTIPRPAIWAGIAAAAAAVILLVNRDRATRPDPAVVTVTAAKTYATGVGQRDSVLLGDGTRIILGPQSRLEVASGYGTSARSVALTGDAYFDVRHDAAKPFSVLANGALVEDIGTTFVIESDAVNRTTVSVVTGSVRLRRDSTAATDGVVLAAGDRGTIDAAGRAHVDRNAVRDEDTAWLHGKLVFRDAPLSQVAAEIERWYGVRLRVADSGLLAQHVTTSFEGEPVDQALRILGLTIGANIQRGGDSALVTSTRGRSPRR